MTLIDELSQSSGFCLIQKQDSDEVLFLQGDPLELDAINQMPRTSDTPRTGRQYHSINIVPFAQIRERGYLARHDGESILSLQVTAHRDLPLSQLLEQLPTESLALENGLSYDCTETEYEAVIQQIVDEEIGNGEGANFVIPRSAEGTLSNFSFSKALTIFKSLIRNDYGTYWKFIFFNGSTYFIGSTPERHLSVEKGRVKMNPISGTFRKKLHYDRRASFKKDLLQFLSDPKEINELFMVVDEELKMMAKMCDQGGVIIGPLLKEMSRLIHSEYVLSGESDKDVLELFKASMFAATVTGSPVENACNIIHKYSDQSRGYYGSALVLLGKDEEGCDFLDSPITIRTAQIETNGAFKISVGATLVRDSIPSEEVKETHSKSAALLSSIVPENEVAHSPSMLAPMANDDDIAETLQMRNQNLSNFWFFKQDHGLSIQSPASKLKITLIHNGDDFAFMLRHIFNALALETTVVPFQDYDETLDQSDITIVGPGPGNPNQVNDPKVKRNLEIVEGLLERKKPSMFVCLGHQLLCKQLGYSVKKKQIPHQGVQEKVNLFGQEELVGYYNTFVPHFEPFVSAGEVSVTPHTNELFAIRGEHFIGYQFHAESILTKNSAEILKEAILHLVR